MKLGFFIGVLLAVIVSSSSISAQENASAETPANLRQNGSWWKVKVEIAHFSGFSRAGVCEEVYPEYLVKIENGTPVVYGIDGEKQEQINCPAVESQLLDGGSEKRGFLKFPMRMGMKPWSATYLRSEYTGRARWVTAESHVVAFGKMRQLKEWELRVLKIEESAKEILRRRIEELGKAGELDAFKIERWTNGELTETYYYAPKVGAVVLFELATMRLRRTVTTFDYHLNQQ